MKDHGPKDYSTKLIREFNLQNILYEYSGMDNLKEDLMKGYKLFQNVIEVLNYAIERGLEANESPVLRLFLETMPMLKDCFKTIGIL